MSEKALDKEGNIHRRDTAASVRLMALIAAAEQRRDSMTAEERAAHDKAQMESFVRAMKPTGDPRLD